MSVQEHELVDYQMYAGPDEFGDAELVPIRGRVRAINGDQAVFEVLEESLDEWYGQRWTVPIHTLVRLDPPRR